MYFVERGMTPHDDQRGHPFGILLVHPGAKPRGIALNKL